MFIKEANFDVPRHVNRCKSGICGSNSPHAVIEGRPKKTVILRAMYYILCFSRKKNGHFFQIDSTVTSVVRLGMLEFSR